MLPGLLGERANGVKALAAASGEPGVMGTGYFGGMSTEQVNRWQQPWRLRGRQTQVPTCRFPPQRGFPSQVCLK